MLPLAALLPWLLHIPDGRNNYVYAFAVGSLSWLLCLAASHQIRLSIEKKGVVAMDATLRVFTLFHFLTCVMQLVRIAFKTEHLNPYDAAVPFPYGMSSGDHIFGLFFENSTYNVMVAMMLMLYFLFKNSWLYALLAAISTLLGFQQFRQYSVRGYFIALVTILCCNGYFAKKTCFPPFISSLRPSSSRPAFGRDIALAACLFSTSFFRHKISPTW